MDLKKMRRNVKEYNNMQYEESLKRIVGVV